MCRLGLWITLHKMSPEKVLASLTWKIMYPESYIQKSSGALPALLSWIARHCCRMRRHLCGPGDFVLIFNGFLLHPLPRPKKPISKDGTVQWTFEMSNRETLFDKLATKFREFHVVIYKEKKLALKKCFHGIIKFKADIMKPFPGWSQLCCVILKIRKILRSRRSKFIKKVRMAL